MAIDAVVPGLFEAITPVLPPTATIRLEAQQTSASHIAAENGSNPREQVEAAVNQIQQFTQALTQNLKFSIDEDTGKTVVKIVDTQTQEIIRQIPTEEAIKIAGALGKLQGVLLNGEA